MTILFVSGVNDQSRIGVTLDENYQLVSVLNGNCSIHGQTPLKKNVTDAVILFGKNVHQRQINLPNAPSLIFNQIADADTHRGALERCVELCTQLTAPVINRPEAILQTTRDRVSEVLQGIPGVEMPRTIRLNPLCPEDVFDRADAENICFPWILRKAGDHGGVSMVRLNSRKDRPALHQYPFDGRDYYLTQFADIKNREGLYHKQRIVVIDGRPILRHTLFDKEWKVHVGSREFMLERGETWESYETRSSYYETSLLPLLETSVGEISRRLGLEYYGIDCHLKPDGQMLIFEANANMNILFNDAPRLNYLVEHIHTQIQKMLARHSGEVVI